MWLIQTPIDDRYDNDYVRLLVLYWHLLNTLRLKLFYYGHLKVFPLDFVASAVASSSLLYMNFSNDFGAVAAVVAGPTVDDVVCFCVWTCKAHIKLGARCLDPHIAD